MNKVEISVLMSVYHAEKPDYLASALQSIADQTLLPLEVVLVIDGNIPRTLELVIERFRDYFRQQGITFNTPQNQENLGLALSLNNGIKHCSYETIARMDTDDICKPERFAEQFKLAEKGKNFVYASSEEFVNSPGDQNTLNVALPPHKTEKVLCFRNPIVHPTVMFNKSLIILLGGYRKFDFFEDHDLWIRVFESASARIAHIEKPLIYFRTNPGHRNRRSGLTYFFHGLHCKLKWINEKRSNRLYILLSLAPFFLFSISPIGMKNTLYRVLRQRAKTYGGPYERHNADKESTRP